jgi:hypothetical protein
MMRGACSAATHDNTRFNRIYGNAFDVTVLTVVHTAIAETARRMNVQPPPKAATRSAMRSPRDVRGSASLGGACRL